MPPKNRNSTKPSDSIASPKDKKLTTKQSKKDDVKNKTKSNKGKRAMITNSTADQESETALLSFKSSEELKISQPICLENISPIIDLSSSKATSRKRIIVSDSSDDDEDSVSLSSQGSSSPWKNKKAIEAQLFAQSRLESKVDLRNHEQIGPEILKNVGISKTLIEKVPNLDNVNSIRMPKLNAVCESTYIKKDKKTESLYFNINFYKFSDQVRSEADSLLSINDRVKFEKQFQKKIAVPIYDQLLEICHKRPDRNIIADIVGAFGRDFITLGQHYYDLSYTDGTWFGSINKLLLSKLTHKTSIKIRKVKKSDGDLESKTWIIRPNQSQKRVNKYFGKQKSAKKD